MRWQWGRPNGATSERVAKVFFFSFCMRVCLGGCVSGYSYWFHEMLEYTCTHIREYKIVLGSFPFSIFFFFLGGLHSFTHSSISFMLVLNNSRFIPIPLGRSPL